MSDSSKQAEYIARREQLERNLVAIAFMEPASAIDAVVGVIDASSFADRDLGAVYAVLADLRDGGVILEFEAVAHELDRRGVIDEIGRHQLREMLTADCSPSNAKFYAEQLSDMAYQSRLCEAARMVLASEFDSKVDVNQLRERFDSRVERADASGTTFTLAEAMDSALAKHEAALMGEVSLGAKTGFIDLDNATSGVHAEQLWLIGARTNVGKTAFALSLCNRLASGATGSDPLEVVFFSMEMSADELAERVWADELSIHYGRISHTKMTRDDIEGIRQSRSEFAKWPFTIDDKPAQTVRDIKAKAKLLAKKGKPDLIVVDTLQRVKPSRRQDRRLELQQICNDLKDVAKELKCAIFVCTQLNASAENTEPDLTHLSEGKQIIEPVDTCLLLHRPDRERNELLVKVEKLRRGPKQAFELLFDGKFQRFKDPAAEIAVDSSGDFASWNSG